MLWSYFIANFPPIPDNKSKCIVTFYHHLTSIHFKVENYAHLRFCCLCQLISVSVCPFYFTIKLPLIVSRDSFSLWTWAHVQTVRSTAFFNGRHYIFLIYFYTSITIHICVPHFYDPSTLVGCWSSVYIRRIIYKCLNVCHFDYTAVAVSG